MLLTEKVILCCHLLAIAATCIGSLFFKARVTVTDIVSYSSLSVKWFVGDGGCFGYLYYVELFLWATEKMGHQ